jgi:hypothetical protein
VDELVQELNRQNELAAAQLNYAKTLVLLRALKAGTLTLENVTLTADGWTVQAVAPSAYVPPMASLSTEME